jgi:hypothetical protein
VKSVWLKMKEPVKPAPTAPVTMLLMPAGGAGCKEEQRKVKTA